MTPYEFFCAGWEGVKELCTDGDYAKYALRNRGGYLIESNNQKG